MKMRVLLLAITVMMTVGSLAAHDRRYCLPGVTLETLNEYMDSARHVDAHVKLFYGNLVNNPTHSYRVEHFDVGFNGCTGRVDERVVMSDGSCRDNVFIFNEQGLLTQSIIQGSKGKTQVNYSYSCDEVLGYTLESCQSGNITVHFSPVYGAHGRLGILTGDSGTRQEFYFNEKGNLAKRIITPDEGDMHSLFYQVTPARGMKRTLVYQGGYIIREEVGTQVFRYHYDFDTATGKKFLIAIKEMKGEEVIHDRTFDYDIDMHGRYTRVAIALDGKPQMTITRSYSD